MPACCHLQTSHLPVPLTAGILASEFQRKKLNLGLLLDVSGSMGSPFNTYYYDAITGKPKELSPEGKWHR